MTHSAELSGVALPPALADAFALPAPQYIENIVLAANVAATFTIPVVNGVKAQIVMFTANQDFYAAYQYQGESSPITAAVPVASTTNGLGVELNPAGRYVGGTGALVSAISLISASNCIISVACFLA